MYVVHCVLLCSVVASAVLVADEPYKIPAPRIEIFTPRGLRISLPDAPGISEMHFRAFVNQETNLVYSADITQEIFQKTGTRWVFEDNRVKLNRLDVLRFWLFVSKDNLGFNLDDQRYVVDRLMVAPPGFLEKQHNRPTENYQPPITHTDPTISESDCPCENETELTVESQPTVTIPPPPLCPQAAATTTVPPPTVATTHTPTASSVELQIWKDILVTLSTENSEFRDKIQVLMDLNSLMINKLEKIGDSNLRKLVIGGKISLADAPFPLAQTVLKEKLGIMDKILVSAVRNSDGTVTMELDTFNDKLNVLLKAQEKLKDSKITISDIGDVGSFNQDADKITFDVDSVTVSK